MMLDNPVQILHDLVKALDEAYITSWQSTASWDKQLVAAQQYLERLK